VGTTTSVGILAIGATWRLAGVPAAGQALMSAATTGNENNQVLAKMLLVKAGNRSVPIVTTALSANPATTGLVEVLASIGTEEARAALLELSHASPAAVPPQNRDAAAQALRTLDKIRRRPGDPR
jgi:hypothetical protein